MSVNELFRHKDLALSCGGALLRQYDPALSKMVGEGRWYDMARIDSTYLITEAPGSYAALSSDVPEGCRCTDYLLLLDHACQI